MNERFDVGSITMSPNPEPVTGGASSSGPRKLVLCFDGTGNKFHGDESDSNILKIFRMLDRSVSGQYHYYQRKVFYKKGASFAL